MLTTYFVQSTIHLSKHHMFPSRSNHVDIKLHFIMNIVAQGLINLDKISTDDISSDMLIKPIPLTKFKLCLNLIRVSHN